MRIRPVLINIVVCLLLTTGCTPVATKMDPPAAESSMNSLDWAGTYTAYMPCADCAGIDTSLILNPDLTWILIARYDTGSENRSESRGQFSWEPDGNHIRLNGVTDAPNRYKVEENRLVQMDMQGNRITGALADKYVLVKSGTAPAPASLFGLRWQMKQIMGQAPIAPPDRPIYIEFAPETNSISGFAGCNQFSGTYELLPGNRLHFSQMVSTMMACAGTSSEPEMLNLLPTVDNYTINKGQLSLNRARMAPLMVFEAVIGPGH